MVTANRPLRQSARAHNEWVVTYTQRDLDAIREQIEQTQAMKRRWLVMLLIIALVMLGGTIALLSTTYALYSASKSDRQRLNQANATLQSLANQTQQQLDARAAKDASDARARADAQAKLDSILPSVLNSAAGGGEVANFARLVYNLPGSRIELSSKPPDTLFRNWKVTSGSSAEVYALVGGFSGGKWIIYSNLISRR